MNLEVALFLLHREREIDAIMSSQEEIVSKLKSKFNISSIDEEEYNKAICKIVDTIADSYKAEELPENYYL